MEQNPSWQVDIHSANEEIPHLLYSPKVHYRAHNSPLPRPCVIFYKSASLRWVFSPSPSLQVQTVINFWRLIIRTK